MLSTINQKLTTIDTQIAQLQQQLTEHKETRKQLLAQQKKIENAIAVVKELRETLPTELLSEFNNAIGTPSPTPEIQVPVTVIEKEDRQAELAHFPKKEPVANEDELFSWQMTCNRYVSSFFDVQKGKVHCTYIGSMNKSHLECWLVALKSWISGFSCEIRLAKRLKAKYELKCWWGDCDRDAVDDLIGFLAGCYGDGKPPAYYLQSDLKNCPQSSLQGQAYHLCCSLEDGKLQPGNVVTHFRRPEHGLLVSRIQGNTAIVKEFRFFPSGNYRESVDYQYSLSELLRVPMTSAIAEMVFEQQSKALQAEKKMTATQIRALASLAR